MKKALKIIGNVLAWVLLIFALLITIVVFSSDRNGGVANLCGFTPMTVETRSMEPTFYQDDLIIVKEVDDIYNLKKDDVITFWTIIDGRRVKNTHRIVEINEFENTRSFVTRGDNNDQDDEYDTTINDIVGVIKFNVHHAAILVDKDPIILLAIVVTLMLQMIVLTALIQHLQRDAQHIQARLNLQYRVRLAQYNYQQNYPNYA